MDPPQGSWRDNLPRLKRDAIKAATARKRKHKHYRVADADEEEGRTVTSRESQQHTGTRSACANPLPLVRLSLLLMDGGWMMDDGVLTVPDV